MHFAMVDHAYLDFDVIAGSKRDRPRGRRQLRCAWSPRRRQHTAGATPSASTATKLSQVRDLMVVGGRGVRTE